MHQNLPANADATAATKNDIQTAGPAIVFATDPAKTYTPNPNVEPTPKAVRSNNVKTLARGLSSPSSAFVFFR